MQKIRIDFDNPGLPQHISAVENDSQSRFFQATLYENGKAYTAPEGATYSIMYRGFGPQNQGWYDTINDGAGKRAACKVSGNVVTCEIARQALQVPGHVSIVLCVTTGKGYMLKSWPIECDCKNDRYDSTAEIQSFFYITQVSNADWTQAIQAVEELKNIIDPTLSLSGKAADAAKVGEAVNAEAERAKGVEGQLKEDMGNIVNETALIEHLKWFEGSINSSNGQDKVDPRCYRTDNYYKGSDYSKITVGDIETYAYKYSYSDGVYKYIEIFQILSEHSFNDNDPYYYRFVVIKKTFTDSEIYLVCTTKIVKDVIALKQLEPRVDELEEKVTITNKKSLYDTDNLTNAYLNWGDGTETSYVNAKTSAFIEVSEGVVLEYNLTVIGKICATIACYDSSYNYIQSKSIRSLGTSGSWILQTGTFTVPSGVAFIKYSTYKGALDSDGIAIVSKEDIKQYVTKNLTGQWNEKKWAAFGTSITDTGYIDIHFLQPTGKYVPFLTAMSGMKVTNYGIAGGSILSEIMNKVLATDVSNFDIVTVEGSVNDHATSKPLGKVGDTEKDTFAGALYQIAKHIYGTSNATLFFITDYVGRYVHINPAPDGSDFYGDCAPTKVNQYNLLQIDYINMMIKQCEYFGIPCITAGQDAGINLLTGNLYLIDHIHSTYVGGKQYAETIWKDLKQYQPRALRV